MPSSLAAVHTASSIGVAPPLGVHWTGAGCSVAVPVGPSVTRAWLCRFGTNGRETRVELTERIGAICWGFVPDLAPGDRYGFRVQGQGHNIAKLLVDPYARAVDGAVDWLHAGDALALGSQTDSARFVPRSVVVDTRHDWQDDRPPHASWSDTIIYELHVKNATRLHPGVPAELRGTYSGLAHPAFTDHLESLGITSVELLPVHHCVDEPRLAKLGLVNHWGYNTLGFFAPDARFSSVGSSGPQVAEFKEMVRVLHTRGIEVLLDVVYNHTAEGDAEGPTLSFRGLDPSGWYRDVDVTGCGNTVDLRRRQPLRLVLDSLRYWVEEMHVDGFRFDLAPALSREDNGFSAQSAFLMAVVQDPILCQVKLIAEPWDIGYGGYQLGAFPAPWAEWNDRYRGTIRDHWRGAPRPLGEVADRMAGSSDIYGPSFRRPWASINFVSAHDGMTVNDLVTYNGKHNEANGEDNRDGTNDNRSWNCGVEGPTDDPIISALRDRQRRNLLATLLLSQGTPMLLAGDEVAHSQQGNNNAYCQDDEISWIDWAEADTELLSFTRRLIALRRSNAALRRPNWLADGSDASWYSPSGELMTIDGWNDPTGAGLQLLLAGRPQLLLCMNDDSSDRQFVLPAGAWQLELATANEPIVPRPAPPVGPRQPDTATAPRTSVTLVSRSIAVFSATHQDPSDVSPH